MTELVKFNVEPKTLAGKSSAKQLRKEGKIPLVLYGDNKPAEMFAVSLNEFSKEYQKGGLKTRLAELTVGGKTISAIAKDVQLHKVTDFPLHADFLRVGKDTVVKVAIAIKVINEDTSPGIKKGGIINLVHRKIDLLCHPTAIPTYIEVDIDGMDIGRNIHINDIKLPKGAKPMDPTNFTIVSIMGRTEEEAVAGATAASA